LTFERLYAAAAALALLSAPAFAEPEPKPYEILTLAEDVYGFVWKDPLQPLIEGNALFVVNDRDVLVVDTSNFPTTARRMVAELRKLTDKPVRYVVNTHWHDDHHSGNAVYREVWPGVEFIAHRDTRSDILTRSYGAREHDLAQIAKSSQTLERWIAAGEDDDGKPMDEAREQRAEAIIEANRWGLDELRAIEEAPPDLTFEDRLVLHRGGRTIELHWLGRGNTRGDIVVLLPNERILATGDLLVYPVPFGFYSYYEEWAATLARLDALPADVLFLSHGYPQRDRTYLHQVQRLLEALVAEAKAAAAAGLTPEQARERIALPEWRERFAAGDEAKARAFDAYFLAPAVERALRQALDEPSALGPPE
jgi:glyoxylase-like metal-dependent hydrolase (beta-lactamase superfamily II)